MKRTSKTATGFTLIGVFVWVVAVSPPAEAQATKSVKPAPDLEAGKQAYLDNCARCHGPTGAGDGRDARRMFPRPRHLSEGVFKFRTTASGTPPTDEDLFQTLSEGLPGSRMPDFQRLPDETRWQLVYYVKGLAPALQGQKPEPLKLGTDPGPKKVNLAKGKELYTLNGCNACHGNLGRGNGPSAATLVDQWNEPIRAADLTQGWNYRSGSSPKEIMARLMTGIDGTPMPSYAEAVKADEVWDLAYYVHSLQVEPRWGRTIEAAKVSGPFPNAIDDPQWAKVPRTDLRLSGNFYRDQQILPTTIRAISIQALYNEKEILFRLSWHDPSENREFPSDAVALAFLPDLKLKWRTGSLRSWPASSDATALNLSKWDASYSNAAYDAFLLGGVIPPGTVGEKPLKQLDAKVEYIEGGWTLLIRRPLEGKLASSVKLEPGKPVAVGLMVWDGGNNEQGRHRANSSWVDLVLK